MQLGPDAADLAEVALIEGISQAENGDELGRQDLLLRRQGVEFLGVVVVDTVEAIIRDIGQDFLFVVRKAEEVRFHDEVIRAQVVLADVDVFPRFVEDRRQLQ